MKTGPDSQKEPSLDTPTVDAPQSTKTESDSKDNPTVNSTETDSAQKGQRGWIAKTFVILICLIFIRSSIVTTWNTHNILLISLSIAGAIVVLLQIRTVDDLFTAYFYHFSIILKKD